MSDKAYYVNYARETSAWAGARSIAAGLLLALSLSMIGAIAGCRPASRGFAGDMTMFGAEAPAEFIDDSFEFMYPIFLRHKIAQGPKAALWSAHYHRRWVRWTGRIRSFTVNGITLRELPITATFDVSLWVNNDERDAIRTRYKVGDVVSYTGRLDSYDDVWRTLYLVNGSVMGAADPGDGGF